MENRELYKQKYEAQLHEWSAKLDVMRAQTEKLTAQAKLDIRPHIDAVHSKFNIAKAKLNEIASTADDKWHGAVKDVDHAWQDFKAAAEGALDAVKTQKKKD